MRQYIIYFNKEKCKVMYLGKSNPMERYMLGATQLEGSLVGKDQGALVDTNNVPLRQRRLPGWIRQSTASRLREVIPSPLLTTGEAASGVFCPVLGSSVQERPGHTAESPVRMMKGLEHLSYEERLRELGLFGLEKRRLRGDLINVYK
ncbi:hypothetical protein QYF61_020034 [Mycteria americana]|uniref:Uncharacterized protein n=1 Tax=Mycteria americana TaxID=33587 RepID=A0AAN7S9I1_MYCAM|nr:hypothetical protein QYF61_020034 [Mycteria americana]